MSDKNIEEVLVKMRMGYSMEHTLKYGEFEFPVRLLTADEEIQVTKAAREEHKESDSDLINLAVMKDLIFCASTINGVPSFSPALLERLTTAEIESLYGRYLSIIHEVDPEFMEMDYELVSKTIEDIKKKDVKARQLGTRTLAMTGIFFLEALQAEGKEVG